jgi:hypothetical protein
MSGRSSKPDDATIADCSFAPARGALEGMLRTTLKAPNAQTRAQAAAPAGDDVAERAVAQPLLRTHGVAVRLRAARCAMCMCVCDGGAAAHLMAAQPPAAISVALRRAAKHLLLSTAAEA